MTFLEIEKVIGTPLPPKAQNHPAWWSNNTSNNVMTQVWLDAGFKTERTERVDIGGRRLVFRRVRPGTPSVRSRRGDASEGSGETAARNRHPLLGAMKGTVTFTSDLDLTQPADPDWGKVYE